jgi:GNAT superfamily N-acetyltransferase
MTDGDGWRPMRRDDLAAVDALAQAQYPDYPERPAVYADRLARAPGWCFALERDGGLAGYLLAHPWDETGPPPLDTVLAGLPAAPTALHLHDCVIAPRWRGRGCAAAVVDRGETAAQGRFRALALVAIAGKRAFWERRGFVDATRPAMRASLESYDPSAAYLVKPLPGIAPPEASA